MNLDSLTLLYFNGEPTPFDRAFLITLMPHGPNVYDHNLVKGTILYKHLYKHWLRPFKGERYSRYKIFV